MVRSATSFILRLSYGYDVKEKDDPFVATIDMAAEQFALSTAPGVFLVNLIPACKSDDSLYNLFNNIGCCCKTVRYIPAWFPGAGFKTIAAEWSKTTNKMVDGPFEFAKEQMVRLCRIDFL